MRSQNKNTQQIAGCLVSIVRLLGYVRQKRHEAGAFYCGFDCALLFGSEACALAAHDAAVRVYKLSQEVDVFVVNVANIVLCKDVHNFEFIF
jgi:hypothetical protein